MVTQVLHEPGTVRTRRREEMFRVGWFRRRAEPSVEKSNVPQERARRLTARGRRRTDSDVAGLDDREVVQGWLRELGGDRDQQVYVDRSWGTVVAVAERRYDGINVFLSDGERTWHASLPGADSTADLAPAQVEHVLLDALTSTGPPSGRTGKSCSSPTRSRRTASMPPTRAGRAVSDGNQASVAMLPQPNHVGANPPISVR